MNTKIITQTQHERYCHKVLFRVSSLSMIHAFIQNGIIITMDANCRYACAHFDNTIDYNDFKEKINYLSDKKAFA